MITGHLVTVQFSVWNHALMDLWIILVMCWVKLPSFRTQFYDHVLICDWVFLMFALREGLRPFSRWKRCILSLIPFSPQFFFFTTILSLAYCLEDFVDLELESWYDAVIDADDFFEWFLTLLLLPIFNINVCCVIIWLWCAWKTCFLHDEFDDN